MTFQPGDKIKWQPDTNLFFKGTVISNSMEVITINFEHPSSTIYPSFRKHYGLSTNSYTFTWSLHRKTHFSLYERLTKEEKINKKIKTLWNNSKYVKKNPQCAY